MKQRKLSALLATCLLLIQFTACSSLPSKDAAPVHSAVEVARQKVQQLDHAPRIVATSPAVVEVCNRLELDLVAVCNSERTPTPLRYQAAEKIGMPMNPDMEKIAALQPDWILSPSSLENELRPKYETMATDWAFLNMKSVPGMYRSIQQLGDIFDKQAQAQQLLAEYESFYSSYIKQIHYQKAPRVLILMGLPGSYIVATENSYVGNLVELAGGKNVYSGTSEEFLTANTEDMKMKEPDIILRTAHALPEQVQAMFRAEFETNDIWKHFQAVQNGNVYDLDASLFGMSATFEYRKALEQLQQLLYPEK